MTHRHDLHTLYSYKSQSQQRVKDDPGSKKTQFLRFANGNISPGMPWVRLLIEHDRLSVILTNISDIPANTIKNSQEHSIMVVTQNKVVTINYTLTDNEGQVLDQSQDGQFAYLHGASNIIPGLEDALYDKKAGDSFSVTVPPELGYGERNESMSQVVSSEMFDPNDKITVGQQFHAQDEQGHMIMITVTKIDGDNITIDGNHPLAGLELTFDVTIIDVRDATEEEISHGHVHMPGHSHH